ncbi:MAG: alpha-E domain-containing protein, partial [Janthinobacterium lividum]
PKGVEWKGDAMALAHCLTFDPNTRCSVLACIVSARENARHVREQISTEMWQRLNSLYLQVTRPDLQSSLSMQASGQNQNEAPTEFLSQVMEAVHQFQGVTDSTMSHGEGWQFIQVGRYIERASATGILLEAYQPELWTAQDALPDSNEYLEWMGLLRSATAFEAYCKVYTADLAPDWILEFLLLDPDFPHSLRFSIDAMQHALEAVQSVSGGTRSDKLERIAGRLRATLSYSSVEEIMSRNVVTYLHDIQVQCREIHNAIYELYVDYSIQAALAG